MRFAEMAAPFFETAEIIEFHHDKKIDAPSGTATSTAQRMADRLIEANRKLADDPTQQEVYAGARGGLGPADIRVHAVRMPGIGAGTAAKMWLTWMTQVTLLDGEMPRTFSAFLAKIKVPARAEKARGESVATSRAGGQSARTTIHQRKKL